MTAPEEWRPVPGSEGYQVSSAGRVRSLPRVVIRRNGVKYTVAGRVLRPNRHPVSGLVTVTLSRGQRGNPRYAYVHRLVADIFGSEENAA